VTKAFKKVYVEISNICNLQCSFCPEVERPKDIMDEELFSKIIGDIAPLTESVCFHLMGEPLGHPKLGRFVEICNLHNLPIDLTSNGTLLNETRSEILLNPIVRQVNFSLHSFEANFPGKDISSYLDKVFGFTKKALEYRPDLYINFRLWNLEDPDGPSKSNAEIFKRIRSDFNPAFDERVNVRWKKGVRVRGRLYVNFDSRFKWPSLDQPIRSTKGFCYGLQSHFGILTDGTLVPCCLDKEGVISLGNCRGRPVLEVLADLRAQKIREGFQQGDLVEELCRKCTFIERFDKKVGKTASLQL
jgi:organic radical activating enzyme